MLIWESYSSLAEICIYNRIKLVQEIEATIYGDWHELMNQLVNDQLIGRVQLMSKSTGQIILAMDSLIVYSYFLFFSQLNYSTSGN